MRTRKETAEYERDDQHTRDTGEYQLPTCVCDGGRDKRGGPCNRCTWDIGNKFEAGERVQLHPATDLWMQGARYGGVLSFDPMTNTVRVKLDRLKRPVALAANLVQSIGGLWTL